uniref:Delta 12 fatty acid desaturase n=1 Tax=Phaeodactylum tricornutum TaxID=2850 RepID=Q84KI8_PHATR|nr:delta 12 fatty acid desaturase [Phaeodactylum tricornutum]
MVRFSTAALLSLSTLTTSCIGAFQLSSPAQLPTSRLRRHTNTAPLSAVAVDSGSSDPALVGNLPLPNNNDNEDKNRRMPMMDLKGIALSGLKGQALSVRAEDFPQAKDLRAVIPKDCFEPDTAKSLGYLSVSTMGTILCSVVGANLLSVLDPSNPLTWPLWAAYGAVTGTVAMGLWVLAHECGHGAFSKNRSLQDAVGYIIHSIMLVPYFSWQRSHAVHHQYTNHMELGETHVPDRADKEGEKSLALRQFMLDSFGKDKGMKAYGGLQSFLHLIVGWPAYLLIGATGGPDRGMTNHFYPNPLSTPTQPKKELFPGNWKEKVYQSDIGIAAVVGALIAWTATSGLAPVMALYGGPLIVINAWLVLYTWLQHTDTDVPHFSSDNHNFVKGALHTIDRPYDKLDPWGIIDFLHHKIGTTHVAHHFDSTIPHYKAQIATDAIKAKFPEVYLYDPTPIPQAMWRVAKGCTAVEQRGDAWVWKNEGIEDLVEHRQSKLSSE